MPRGTEWWFRRQNLAPDAKRGRRSEGRQWCRKERGAWRRGGVVLRSVHSPAAQARAAGKPLARPEQEAGRRASTARAESSRAAQAGSPAPSRAPSRAPSAGPSRAPQTRANASTGRPTQAPSTARDKARARGPSKAPHLRRPAAAQGAQPSASSQPSTKAAREDDVLDPRLRRRKRRSQSSDSESETPTSGKGEESSPSGSPDGDEAAGPLVGRVPDRRATIAAIKKARSTLDAHLSGGAASSSTAPAPKGSLVDLARRRGENLRRKAGPQWQ